MKLPPGSQPDSHLVLKSKGIPNFDGKSRGNQYVLVKVQIPKIVTDKQKELLKQFEEEEQAAKNTPKTSFMADAMKRLKSFIGVSKKNSTDSKPAK